MFITSRGNISCDVYGNICVVVIDLIIVVGSYRALDVAAILLRVVLVAPHSLLGI
jgi:hypothetical protein